MTRRPSHEQVHPTLAEWLANELRQQIRSGELPGGTHLRQTQVAERFGVSSTPVREAFALLQRAGILTSAPHKGVFVASPSLDDLRENYEIRIRLEAHATATAVPGLTVADLAELRRLLDELAPLSLEDEYQRYYELNEAFHDTIYAAANRPRLLALIGQLRDEPASFLGLYGRPPLHLDARRSNAQHEAVYEACVSGDADRAAEAMADHLQDALDRVANSLAAEPAGERAALHHVSVR
jgi:DNA-binding GntR family transcriptional regulator